jgi:uncharacterized protein (DUF1810 family)
MRESQPVSKVERFRKAQNSAYEGFDAALDDMRAGAKSGHWIWYIFPQIAGLGTSQASRMFAIEGWDEAVEFLNDPVLCSRLVVIARAVAEQLQSGKALRVLMGSDIDARKVVSSLTLFGHVARKLHEADGRDAYESLAAVSDEVLALAASQGYPACAYTLGRIRSRRPSTS